MPKSKKCQKKCKVFSDYVIVGLGSAGSILARKISDDFTKKVTVIESGRNLTKDPVILAPDVFAFDPESGGAIVDRLAFDSKFTKNYPFPYGSFNTLFPTLNTNAGALQAGNLQHGQTWGGSSAVNYFLNNRGTPDVWDEWAAISGNPQWSQVNVLPIFKSIEKYSPVGTDVVTCSQRGTNGEISVQQNPRLAYNVSTVLANSTGTLATYTSSGHPYLLGHIISTTGFTNAGFNVLNATITSVVPAVSFTIAVATTPNASDNFGAVVAQNLNIQIGLKNVANVPMIEDYNSFPTKNIQLDQTSTNACVITARGSSPFQQYITALQNDPSAHRSFAANTYINDTIVSPNGCGVGGRQLKIHSNSTVVKILFDGLKAVGVEYLETMSDNKKKLRRIYAKTKVILCAGALQTPAILQRSGVGDATKLNGLGIPLVLNQPLVGQGLKSHPGMFLAVNFSVAGAIDNVQSFISANPDLDRRDVQWLMNFIGAPNFNIGYYFLMNPKSEGTIDIQSTNPFVDPKLNPNFYTALNTQNVISTTGNGVTATYTVAANTYEVGDVVTVNMTLPIDSAFNLTNVSITAVTGTTFTATSTANGSAGTGVATVNIDASIMFRCFELIKASCANVGQSVFQPDPASTYSDVVAYFTSASGAIPTNHQCRTTRMGTNFANSVVNGNLHVHGLSNLMIADNSVAPRISNGNTCMSAYTIGTVASNILGF